MEKKELVPPSKDFGNKVHEYFKESIKTITGGFINPLIDFVLPSLHQKRFENWCENIYQAIIEIQDKIISTEELIDDEEFISLLKECIIIASKTHQTEKHLLLKNLLINHFENPAPFDITILFAKKIDSLTIPHLALFQLIGKYLSDIKELNEFSKIEKIFKSDTLASAIPNNSYRMLLHDLENMNLVAVGDIAFKTNVRETSTLSAGGENPNLPFITITEFGEEFKNYLMTK